MNADPLILQTILACIIKPRYIKNSVVLGVLRMMTTGWPNILWQHIILQLNISCHEYRKLSVASWIVSDGVSPYRSNGVCSEIWGICYASSQCALHWTAEWPRQFPCLPRLRPCEDKLDAPLDFECWYSLIGITIAHDTSSLYSSLR